MARTTSISVSFRATINLGHFESVTAEYGETIAIDATDDVKEIREKFYLRVKGRVEREVIELRQDSRFDHATGKSINKPRPIVEQKTSKRLILKPDEYAPRRRGASRPDDYKPTVEDAYDVETDDQRRARRGRRPRIASPGDHDVDTPLGGRFDTSEPRRRRRS